MEFNTVFVKVFYKQRDDKTSHLEISGNFCFSTKINKYGKSKVLNIILKICGGQFLWAVAELGLLT